MFKPSGFYGMICVCSPLYCVTHMSVYIYIDEGQKGDGNLIFVEETAIPLKQSNIHDYVLLTYCSFSFSLSLSPLVAFCINSSRCFEEVD